MKIKLTIENRLGLSNEVLAMLVESDAEVKNIEVKTGFIYLETEPLEKTVERNLASQLMQIHGVKWVESIALMPTHENNLFLDSLLNAIGDPVIGINNKGVIVYQNNEANAFFSLHDNRKIAMKDIFEEQDWASKIDTAASGDLPVNITTVSGTMLVEVRAIQQQNSTAVGAVLVFHKPEYITARSHIIDGANRQGFEGLLTENSVMQDVINRAKHMCNTPVPLAIYGETGVGKTAIAQAIHHTGKRKNNLFSSLDCSTLKSLQIEIELFGLSHPIKGKAGLLEMTDNGTILIKSIHEMPSECQLKLLEFINNGYFFRVNGSIKKTQDIKIIVTCPQTLDSYVQNKKFNRELFYTLDMTHLNVPALRERKEDIKNLIAHYLQQLANEGAKAPQNLSFDALNKVKSYYWPENITQLRNVLFKASLVSRNATINADDLEIDGHVHIEDSLENRSLPEAVAEFEKHFLQHWYQKYSSTRKLAAQLGVSHTTIAQKLIKYKIN